MADPCVHATQLTFAAAPSGDGCLECLRDGTQWVQLRMCQDCGHIGCCDSSPGRHATAHYTETQHPVIRSYEPGEEWFWCYVDEGGFELPDAPEALSHT
ncbi:UBP-type zinc finger domain-containing protein [Nocardioides campestrisoli]|uniref:UBP-type zinc finger domain-containing protein n=1 Tax=Nocardioides campestrisoli TaxID=2736757 RepID=UPI00163DA9D6|nr:UBP-type zinc finger domain-containing protein [Nocardioides campestrisoli]